MARLVTEDLALDARLDLRGALALADEGVTVVLGPSGAGKTSLLRAVMGLDRPTRGRVRFDGAVWSDAAAGACVAVERRGLGWSPQRPRLLPHLDVLENVAFGAEPRRAEEALDVVGAASLAARAPASLSGGEAQRVSLARALARRPRLALLDEPFAAIDRPSVPALRAAVSRALRAAGSAVVVVTHDPDDLWALADRVVVLSGGRALQSGAASEVLSRPASAEVARLVGYDNVVETAPGRGYAAPTSAVRFTKWTSGDEPWAEVERVSASGPGPRAWARGAGGEALTAGEVDPSLRAGDRCAVRVDAARAARFGEG
ncbi:MAG: ATP-binding cassette domain-containing protein [Polyangiales bacterium]